MEGDGVRWRAGRGGAEGMVKIDVYVPRAIARLRGIQKQMRIQLLYSSLVSSKLSTAIAGNESAEWPSPQRHTHIVGTVLRTTFS